MNKIYFLKDPRNNEIRYVGKTSKELKIRFWNHITVARTKRSKRHICNWIRQLLSQNLLPIIVLHENETSNEEINEREIFWIKEMRDRGCNLVNLTDGGEGHIGYKPSKETIEKTVSKTRGLKRSEEIRNKIRESRLNKTNSEEIRQKIRKSMTGYKQTQEHIEAIRRAMTGRPNLSAILKTNEQARNSKLTVEQVKEIKMLSKTTNKYVLAEKYGVSSATIIKIKTGRAWKHVEV